MGIVVILHNLFLYLHSISEQASDRANRFCCTGDEFICCAAGGICHSFDNVIDSVACRGSGGIDYYTAYQTADDRPDNG